MYTQTHRKRENICVKAWRAEKKKQASLATLSAAMTTRRGDKGDMEVNLLEIGSTGFVEIASSIALLEDV